MELYAPDRLKEGFQSVMGKNKGAVAVTDSNSLISAQFPRRGDVSYNTEAQAYKQDGRYFADYADVQGVGFKNDFCRMIVPSSADTKSMFFACALGGTSGLATDSYRTRSVKDGFIISRDDYMRDVFGDGRDSYCRIFKGQDGTFQPMCLRAGTTKFAIKDQVDPNPPEEIELLLEFYQGCVIWLRFYDDMLDYIVNVFLQRAGGIKIAEYPPRPAVSFGLPFNGLDQFLRIGDEGDLTMGTKVMIRQIRAISVWVYFDKFTNNAHIFDFGNGAGRDNFFLGIIGKGDAVMSDVEIRSTAGCGCAAVMPDSPSGAQPVPEVPPQKLMLSTQGYLDCPEFQVTPDRLEPSRIQEPKKKEGEPQTATLLYEVWDTRLRKMQIRVSGAIPLKKWTHICITATSSDSLRPDVALYVNGVQRHVESSGFLPQPMMTSHNYIGKSNWYSDSTQYELRDELFAGNIFDLRMYESIISEGKLRKVMRWGKKLLGI